MTRLKMPKPHRTPMDESEESEGAPLPVEPDEGLVPPMIPDDPEYDRLIDPE
jgi:hypothetical protein